MDFMHFFRVGMGYGCMTAVQNTGLALFPQVIGVIQDAPSVKSTNWKNVAPLMILAGSAVLSLLLVFFFVLICPGIPCDNTVLFWTDVCSHFCRS